MTIVIHDLEEAMTRIHAHEYDRTSTRCPSCDDVLLPNEVCGCGETCGDDPENEDNWTWDDLRTGEPSRA